MIRGMLREKWCVGGFARQTRWVILNTPIKADREENCTYSELRAVATALTGLLCDLGQGENRSSGCDYPKHCGYDQQNGKLCRSRTTNYRATRGQSLFLTLAGRLPVAPDSHRTNPDTIPKHYHAFRTSPSHWAHSF